MKRWAWVVGAAGVALAAVMVWREAGWRGAAAGWAEREAVLVAGLADARAELDAAAAGAAAQAGELAEAAIGLQTLRDRAGNLEAQRDHLRAEAERQGARLRSLEAEAAQAEERLAQARHRLLEQEALPRELRGQLALAQARLHELEAGMDARAETAAGQPQAFVVEGASSDQAVFALSGLLAEAGRLPYPVVVCRGGRVLLDGWLHRIEDGLIIGHARRWQAGASALVKGEKVFIFSRQNHEADL